MQCEHWIHHSHSECHGSRPLFISLWWSSGDVCTDLQGYTHLHGAQPCFNRTHSLRQVLCFPICVSASPVTVFAEGEGVLNVYWILYSLPCISICSVVTITWYRSSSQCLPEVFTLRVLFSQSCRPPFRAGWLFFHLLCPVSHHRFLPWNKKNHFHCNPSFILFPCIQVIPRIPTNEPWFLSLIIRDMITYSCSMWIKL